MFVFATNDPKVLDAYRKGMMDAKNMGATKPKAPSRADLEALVKQAERIDKDALKMSMEHDLMPRLTGAPGYKPFGEEDYEELVSVYTYLIRCYQLGHAINSKMIRLWQAAMDVPATDDVELPPADVNDAIEEFQAGFLRPVAKTTERVKAKLDELQESMAGITDLGEGDDDDGQEGDDNNGTEAQPEPGPEPDTRRETVADVLDDLDGLVQEGQRLLDKAANKLCADHDLMPRLRREPDHVPFNEESFGELLSVYTYLLRYYRLGELVKKKMIRLEGVAESISEAGDVTTAKQVTDEIAYLQKDFLNPVDKALAAICDQMNDIVKNAASATDKPCLKPGNESDAGLDVAMMKQMLKGFPELVQFLEDNTGLRIDLSEHKSKLPAGQRIQEEQVRLQLEATKLDRDISKVTTAHDLLPRLFRRPGYKPFNEDSFDELVGLYTHLVRAFWAGAMVRNKMERVWKIARNTGDKALADRADREHDELVLNFLDPVKVIYLQIEKEMERILAETANGPAKKPDPDQTEIQALVQRVMDEFKAKAESRHQKEAVQDADLAKRVLDDLQKDTKPKA